MNWRSREVLPSRFSSGVTFHFANPHRGNLCKILSNSSLDSASKISTRVLSPTGTPPAIILPSDFRFIVNKGKKKGRGGARPRPSSLRGLARVWRMGFASARHLVRLSGHTAGIIDGRTGQADGKMYWTSRHNSFPGALYRT